MCRIHICNIPRRNNGVVSLRNRDKSAEFGDKFSRRVCVDGVQGLVFFYCGVKRLGFGIENECF